MNVNYHHKNVEPLGDASREYIETKLGSIEEMVTIKKTRVDVEQTKLGFLLKVELSNDGHTYRAEQAGQSVNECIDIIEEELKQQIRRSTKKERDLKERGARSIKKKTVIDEAARF